MLRAVKWASGSKYHSQRYPLRCKRLQRCLGTRDNETISSKYVFHMSPPQEITHCRRVRNPATTECRMSGCIHHSSWRIASLKSDRLDGRDLYTQDFKYPHSPKFSGVRSGDRKWGPMMEESIIPHPTVTLGECSGFKVYTRGFDVAEMDATVMGINVTMDRKMSFICQQDVKYSRGILFKFGESPSRKFFSLHCILR
ncbi:hypothetical protein NPIL_571481 [Nephila pilipes]|uniref:Uncharacterized protein n=1 Tax=Nephila pilipes TaxID=299642 RepID=A0A8X6UKV7_NEPPI|nr:hypothetical protein NPIL_571481 [Nephila pilipes]